MEHLRTAEVAAGNLFGVLLGRFLQKRRLVPCVVGARLGMAVFLVAILGGTRTGVNQSGGC